MKIVDKNVIYEDNERQAKQTDEMPGLFAVQLCFDFFNYFQLNMKELSGVQSIGKREA